METKISKSIILRSDLHYSFLNFIKDDDEKLPIKEWVEKYRNKIPAYNIIWLLFRKKFLSDRDLRLFNIWCAREALSLVKNPDIRCINACDISEKFANKQATKKELNAARVDAYNAREAARIIDTSAHDFYDSVSIIKDRTAYHAACAAYETTYAVKNFNSMASCAAAHAAASNAVTIYTYDISDTIAYHIARDIAYDAQLNHLLSYF
jgi:hypothetical protein